MLQPLRYLGAFPVAHGHDHLVGLGVVVGRIPRHLQAVGLQALGEALGVVHDVLLVFVLELVHLIGSHQQAQLGAQVMVGYAAWEGPAFDGLPETVFQFLFLVVHRNDATLGPKESLMGGPGDDLRALLEGLLEVGAHQAQHMGHIVHDGGGDPLLVHKLADGGHRLPVQHHALAEDDQLGLILVDELFGLLHVDLINVILAHREVHDGMAFGHRVDGDIVPQGAHGLGGKVAALDDVVVHHIAQALGIVLAIQPVLPIHQGGEGGHIGHLAADDPGLHLGAAEVFLHLLHQQLLHPVDELGALVIEDIRVVEGFYLFMLRIAEGRVRGAQQLYGPAGAIFRGDQVDAPVLPPVVVFRGLPDQVDGLFIPGRGVRLGGGRLRPVQDGPGKRRRIRPHMAGRHHSLEPLAPHIDLYHIVREHVAGNVGQADGTLGGLL